MDYELKELYTSECHSAYASVRLEGSVIWPRVNTDIGGGAASVDHPLLMKLSVSTLNNAS